MSFLKLSDELLLQIFTLSKHFEPSSDWAMKMKDLRNIILTCSRFYRVGQDVLYRQMDLGSGKPLYSRFNNFLDTITVHPTRASSVRKVTFSWSGRDIKEWELVFDIIIRLPLIHTVELFVCRGSTAEPRHFHLSHFLDRCFDVPIQNLVIWDHYITSEDIGKLSVIRNVKNLKISLPDKDVSAEKLIVPSTGGHCNMVKLYFSSVNLPPKKVCISSILKQYPGLQELTWDYTENSAEDDYFSPTEFISALLPIHATLVKLNLAITPESSHSSQLDFSQFTALKVLRVYERLMFQFNRGNQWALELHSEGEIQGDRLRLSERLPATLERLDVVFCGESCFLEQSLTTSADHQWILALARNKDTCFKRLSSVTLIEAFYRPSAFDAPFAESLGTLLEWNYPEEVIVVYKSAKIRLEVLCTGRRYDHYCDCSREGRFS